MHSINSILASGTTDLEGSINSFSIRVILTAALLLVVFLLVASIIVKNEKYHVFKTPLFVLIAATIILPSLLLTGSTVYVNTVSESKGPVHWHADIEFWVCGQEIELREPTGFLSNKIGTSTYHEHDDKRIHLEGVVVEKSYDASLEKFMDVTNGSITNSSITIATEDNPIEDDIDGDIPTGNPEIIRNYIERDAEDRAVLKLENGQECGSGVPAELQVFQLSFNESNNTYTQTKLSDPGSYIMRDESIVPSGDCLIVEFDEFKTKTNRLCQQYGVRDADRCTEFGVTTFNAELCNIRQELTAEQLQPVLQEELPLEDTTQTEGEEQPTSPNDTIEENTNDTEEGAL